MFDKLSANLVGITYEFLEIKIQSGNLYIALDDEQTFEYLNKLSKSGYFDGVFNYEEAEWILESLIEHFEISKNGFDMEIAEKIIVSLKKSLQTNIKDYWVIVPLVDGVLSETIVVNDDIRIVCGDRDEKVKYLSGLIKIDGDELDRRFSATEKYRSPLFLSDPLLVIKIRNHFRSIPSHAGILIYYINYFLHVMYWGWRYPRERMSRLKLLKKTDQPPLSNEHFVIQSNGNDWGQYHLGFSYKCGLKLDWLKDSFYKTKLINFLSLLDRGNFDELTDRYLRAIRFFARGISVGGKDRYFENESDTILFLNIASEICLLEDWEENKSQKVSIRLSKKGKPYGMKSEQCQTIIRNMTKARGHYVHEGLGYWGDDPEEISHFKQIVARFLSEAYYDIVKCKKTAQKSMKTPLEEWMTMVKRL